MNNLLSKAKTLEAIEIMGQMFPDARCELNHRNPFELLIATILSAQTTDVSVNKVTPRLFQLYPNPVLLSQVSIEDVIDCIRTLGLYKNKAKNIILCAQQLVANFNGQVPQTHKDLESLSGVGRKTANVVLSVAFGVPAIAVDTHVERVSKRLRIAKESDSVKEVEETLMKKIPKKLWSAAHHRMIFFGRYHCTSRAPKCQSCPLLYLCQDGQNRLGLSKKK